MTELGENQTRAPNVQVHYTEVGPAKISWTEDLSDVIGIEELPARLHEIAARARRRVPRLPVKTWAGMDPDSYSWGNLRAGPKLVGRFWVES